MFSYVTSPHPGPHDAFRYHGARAECRYFESITIRVFINTATRLLYPTTCIYSTSVTFLSCFFKKLRQVSRQRFATRYPCILSQLFLYAVGHQYPRTVQCPSVTWKLCHRYAFVLYQQFINKISVNFHTINFSLLLSGKGRIAGPKVIYSNVDP